MLRGTFDQLKALLSWAPLNVDDWGQSKQRPPGREKIKESACAAWVRPLVGVCNCTWSYTCKAMRSHGLPHMETGAVSASCLTGPSLWWPFAVHLVWPVQCTLCTSTLRMVLHRLFLRSGRHFHHACCCCICIYVSNYLCTLMVQFATSLIKKEGKIWQLRNGTKEKSPFIYVHTQLLLKCDEKRWTKLKKKEEKKINLLP
jgi:hypothetical protein